MTDEGTADLPLVSIVTPTLNRASLLEFTLRAVRSQSYPNVEHIVVDGGSTDGTVELLRRYESTYRMRWSSSRDQGMYPAINQGFRSASGEILAYLNSDDLYFPWTVEVVVEAFRRRPDADFIYGDALAINDETGAHMLYMPPPFKLEFIRRNGFLPQPSVFWRRPVFEAEGGFDETLRYVADCDLWMRAGARRRFVRVSEFLSIERLHSGTLREAESGPVYEELKRVRSRYLRVSGRRHEIRRRLLRLRALMWAAWLRLQLMSQAALPARLRSGRWARLIGSGRTQLSFRWFLVWLSMGLGRIGRFHDVVQPRMIRPSRYWLEPPP